MDQHSGTPSVTVLDPRRLSIRAVGYCRRLAGGAAELRIHATDYDAAGRAIQSWDPRLWLKHQDDPLVPANLTTVYDLSGRAVCTRSVDAGMRLNVPGPAGEVLCIWDSRGTRAEVTYDGLLRPTAMFEQGPGQPRRCVERLQYAGPEGAAANQCGQRVRHDDPAGSQWFDAFSLGGDCLDQRRRFTLDAGEPDWPEADTERERLLEPGPGARTQWRFSPLREVLAHIDAQGHHRRFYLTLDGRLREARLLIAGQGSWRTVVEQVRYNAEGRIERQTLGNGVQTLCRYRPEDGRLLEQRSQDGSGQALQDLLYSYDRMGNVLSIEDKALPVRFFANQRIEPISRYAYDSLYQLINASGWERGDANRGPRAVDRIEPLALSNYQQSYDYDDGGNLLKLTHVGAQHPGHQLHAARYSNRCLPWRNGVPPTEEQIAAGFDANGNQLALQPGQALRWNPRNQLQSVSPVQRESGLDDIETYHYDGQQQRVRKRRLLQSHGRTLQAEVRYLPGLEFRTDNGTSSEWQVITVQAGLHPVRVLHWDSGLPPGVENDQWRYSLVDHLNSSTLEVSGDGRLISHEVFYPFGETAWYSTDDIDIDFKIRRYAGKERDATGLYYFGFRYYQPWLQRWANPDPGGGIDGPNRYRALRNNPLVYEDLDGRVPQRAPATGSMDRTYHELAQRELVTEVQAKGMQPIRNFFEQSSDPYVQAYRREIPRALEELGAKDNSNLMNTHQAHVIAAARTNTASPSGAVLYHSGELMSAAMSTVVGENVTSRIMGPLSVAFNSPVEAPEVLAGRRDAVAGGFLTAGKLAMYSKQPAVKLLGAASVAMGNAMRVSEAQTVIQHRMLSNATQPGAAVPGMYAGEELVSEHKLDGYSRMLQQAPGASRSTLPAPDARPTPVLPSALAQELFAVAFAPVPAEEPQRSTELPHKGGRFHSPRKMSQA